MLREIFVLESHGRVDQRRRDIAEAASRSGISDRAVSVTRRTLPLRSRTRVEKSMPSSSGGFGNAEPSRRKNQKRNRHTRSQDDKKRLSFTCPLSTTLIFPPTPRAFTLRSYIDSAKTGGTTKLPRLSDLIW